MEKISVDRLFRNPLDYIRQYHEYYRKPFFVPGQRADFMRKPRGGQNLLHFYSIHVIAEFNLSGSEIICRQICA